MVAIVLGMVIILSGIDMRWCMAASENVEYITLYFVDNTIEKWASNDSAVMELVDNTNGTDHYWMTKKDESTWMVSVPASAYNITFNRYSSDKTTQWNSWSAGGRDNNNAYFADGSEYGHWECIVDNEDFFHTGDVIFLDISEFNEWKNDDALMYVNFSNVSKEENGRKDISLLNADKEKYNPKLVNLEMRESIYIYVVTEEDEGENVLRFWRGNTESLWNCSIPLSYEEYKNGNNCIKITDWNDEGIYYENEDVIDLNKDSDNDGLPDYNEDKIGTDKNRKDTDEDGLNDYLELSVGYSPILNDTDNNGINDGNEDYDNDGIINVNELGIDTKITSGDTDSDDLSDYEEIQLYHTLPTAFDTDGDGVPDGIEIKYGMNPLVKDSDSDGIEDSLETIAYIFDARLMIDDYDQNVYPEIQLVGDIETVDSFEMNVKENSCILNWRIPGYIGSAYEFTTSSEFESARVTFNIADSLFEDENFTPAIYYFNEEQQVLELVSDQTVDGNTVSAMLEHFSTYIVLNKEEFEKVWETEIAYFDDEEKEMPLDIAFVIDASGSMSNDPQPKNDKDGLRLTLSKEMVRKMETDDRAMVIKFNSSASLLQTLTDDKTLITSAINKVDSYSTTAMCDGIHLANTIYASHSDTNHRKIMIVITDGIDNWSRYSVTAVIDEARNNDVKVYTIGLGKQIFTSDLERIALETGGKYYYAEVASDLEEIYNEIEYETVDYTKDSNNDGISDYHTKKMCEGELRVGTGISVFEGIPYEEIQKNDDYDGDGLKNGEEIEIKKYMTCVSIRMISDPTTALSDADVYSDYEEVSLYGTNPLEKNIIIEEKDVDMLLEGEYAASLYEEEYLNSGAKQIAIWIGNNIYASNYDEVEIYKDMLIDYFENSNKSYSEEIEEQECIDFFLKYATEVSYIVEESRKKLKNNADALDKILELEKQIEHIKISVSDLVKSSEKFTKEEFYREYDKLQSYLQTASQESDDIKKALDTSVTVKGRLHILAQGKLSAVFSKTLSFTCFVLQAENGYNQGIEDYWSLKANIETLQGNIYMLELLSQNAYNDNVKEAASSLLDIARVNYVDKTEEIVQSLKNEGINFTLHSLIQSIPVVGFWTELSLMIASNFTPASDVCSYAIRIIGASCIAEELAIDFKLYICREWEYLEDGELIYVVYGDSAHEAVKRYANLVGIRIFGEREMINLQETIPDYIKWKQQMLGFDSNEIIYACNIIIDALVDIKYKYLFKCF